MKQKKLDIQHESDWSNSTQIFNEKAALKFSLMRKMNHIRTSFELEVNLIIRIFN